MNTGLRSTRFKTFIDLERELIHAIHKNLHQSFETPPPCRL